MKQFLLACALGFAGPALAQQAPPASHGAHGIPAATGTFRATVLLETPLLGTEQRIYRLYQIDLGPGGSTPHHMHPGDEIALVTEGSVTLELQGDTPRTFQAGQTFHPRPVTPHIARNASATAPARLTVSSITEAGARTALVAPDDTTFQAGQTFHPRPVTPHIARNASATAPARLTVSSITEAGKPSTILVPVTN